MAQQELLLLEPIENLGNEGDQVTVKAGFARNFLLPHGKAIPVTRANKKQVESLRKRAEVRLQQLLENAEKVAAKLEKISIAFAVQTGPGGKMFGAITALDLIKRLAEEGVELEKKQVNLYTPVKSLGRHSTKIKLHADVTVEFEFEVVSENPIEDEGEGAETEKAPATE
jgi:large subunit ribosomal protein L9